MAIDLEKLANQFAGEAAKIPGQTWQKIKTGSAIFLKSYFQSLNDIAEEVAANRMTLDDGKSAAENARFLLDMGIAHSTQVTLNEIQKFLDSVLSTMKATINGALPIAVL
jgi:hypothetical protein